MKTKTIGDLRIEVKDGLFNASSLCKQENELNHKLRGKETYEFLRGKKYETGCNYLNKKFGVQNAVYIKKIDGKTWISCYLIEDFLMWLDKKYIKEMVKMLKIHNVCFFEDYLLKY